MTRAKGTSRSAVLLALLAGLALGTFLVAPRVQKASLAAERARMLEPLTKVRQQ